MNIPPLMLVPRTAAGVTLRQAVAGLQAGQVEERWSFSLGAEAAPVEPRLEPDGTTYAGTRDGRLVAVDATGKQMWSAQLAGPLEYPPVPGPDGKLFVLAGGHLHQLGAGGSLAWKSKVGLPPTGPPVVSPEGERVWVATQGQQLVPFDSRGRAGAPVSPWKAPIPFYVAPGPGRQLLLIRRDGEMLRYDPDALLFKTRRLPALPGIVNAPPRVGADGRVYALAMAPGVRFSLVSLDPTSGEVRMRHSFAPFQVPGPPALGVPGSLAVHVLGGGGIELFDSTGGNTRTVPLSLPGQSSLAVTPVGDGFLISGPGYSRLVVDGKDVPLPTQPAAPPVSSPDGSAVYLGSDSRLHRLGPVSPLEAASQADPSGGSVQEHPAGVVIGGSWIRRRGPDAT